MNIIEYARMYGAIDNEEHMRMQIHEFLFDKSKWELQTRAMLFRIVINEDGNYRNIDHFLHSTLSMMFGDKYVVDNFRLCFEANGVGFDVVELKDARQGSLKVYEFRQDMAYFDDYTPYGPAIRLDSGDAILSRE